MSVATLRRLREYATVAPTVRTDPVRLAHVKYGQGILGEPAAVNLALSPTNNFDSRWFGAGGGAGTVTRLSSGGPVGSGGYVRKKWTTAPTSSDDTGFNTPTWHGGILLPEGTTVTASLYMRSNRPQVISGFASWTDGTSEFPPVNVATLVPNVWTRVVHTFVVPVGKKLNYYAFGAYGNGAVNWRAGDTLDAAGFQVEPGANVTTYMDGSLGAGYTWESSNNILPVNDATFEANLGSWTPGQGNPTVVQSTGWAIQGTHSMLITATAPGITVASQGTTFPVTANLPYAVSGYYRPNVTGRLHRLFIRFYDAALVVISTPQVDAQNGVANTPLRVGGVVTAPAGATQATLFMDTANGNNPVVAGDSWYVDGVQVEQKDHVTPYGSTGVADNTTSARAAGGMKYSMFPVDGQSVTVCAWVIAGPSGGASAFVNAYFSSDPSGTLDNLWLMSKNDSGNAGVGCVASGGSGGVGFNPGDLLFIAGVVNGTSRTGYISKNGGPVTAFSAGGDGNAIGASLDTLDLITTLSGQRHGSGAVEQVLVYNTALTAAEIAALAAAGAPTNYADDDRITAAVATPAITPFYIQTTKAGGGLFDETAYADTGDVQLVSGDIWTFNSNTPAVFEVNDLLVEAGRGDMRFKVTSRTDVRDPLNPVSGTSSYTLQNLLYVSPAAPPPDVNPGDLITAVTASFGAQYEWAGVLFGTGSPLIVESIEGLDSMPDFNSDDTDHNDDHGTMPGIDLMRGREITMTIDVDGVSHADIMATYRTLARVMRPLKTDVAFVFQRPNEVKKQVFARPRKRSFPSNNDVAHGLSRGALQWLAGDPRIHSLAEKHVQIVLAAGVNSGQVVLHNSGDFHGFPRFVLTGAGSNPRIAVSAQTSDPADGTNFNNRTIALDLVMAAGDVLSFSPKTKDIRLNGASDYAVRRNDNQWWEHMPGDQTVTFSRTATTGIQTLDIYWYDTWL